MSTKHTPWPWALDGENGCSYYEAITGADGHFVATFYDSPNEADARLIAAAPELLEALRECVNLMTAIQVSPHHYRDVVAFARAAIAKATGEAA